MAGTILKNASVVTNDTLSSFDFIIFDCDGVLWNGNTVISGGPNVLQSFGKQLYYATNNSTKRRKDYLDKLSKLGYPVCLENIVCTARSTAIWIAKQKYLKKVYLLSSQAVADELNDLGIQSIGAGPDTLDPTNSIAMDAEIDNDVTCVVAGLDLHFNYTKLYKALSYLLKPRCAFVATNEDTLLPIRDGKFAPGAGTIVSAVRTACGRDPDVVIGKPTPTMFQMLQESNEIDPKRTLFIGDRLDTDMAFAHNCGIASCLVLTGVTTLEEMKEKERLGITHLVPDFYIDSIASFAKF